MTNEELAQQMSHIAGVQMAAIGCLAQIFSKHMDERGTAAMNDLEKLYRLISDKKTDELEKVMFGKFADVIQKLNSRQESA